MIEVIIYYRIEMRKGAEVQILLEGYLSSHRHLRYPYYGIISLVLSALLYFFILPNFFLS